MPEEELGQEGGARISIVEVLLITPYLILIDIASIFLIFVALDDFWILDIAASVVAFYLWMKGLGWTNFRKFAFSFLGEVFPYVGLLPLYTIGFLFAAYGSHMGIGKVVAVTGAARGAVRGAQQIKEAGGGKFAQGAAAVKGAARGARGAEEGQDFELGAQGATPAIPREAPTRRSEERREAGPQPFEIPTEERSASKEPAPPGVPGTKEEKEKLSREAFEREEVETFGMRPEPLSKYETEKIVSTPQLKDVEKPNNNEKKAV